MSDELHIGMAEPRPGISIPIVDCKSWYLAGRTPRCRKDLDLECCASCQSRETRNGDLSNPPIIGRGEAIPPHRPAPARAVIEAKKPIRGLGDLVAKATTTIGIKPCGKCKERQAMLNKLVPFPVAQEEGTNGSPEGKSSAT